MLDRVLSAKIRECAPASAVDQENVLQELMQHYVLASLSRAGLFAEAMFHGDTCLRIVYGMNRFSEDLDFLLKQPAPNFRWQGYLEAIRKDCAQEGIPFEVQDQSHVQRFLPLREQEGLRAWSADFFCHQLGRLNEG